jgi:hypothetical protein
MKTIKEKSEMTVHRNRPTGADEAGQMEVKATSQIKKFFHWYFFTRRKTLLEWFMAKFPNFPLHVSIVSLLLIMLRPEVESCIRHIQQIGQQLILLLGLQI